MLLEALQELCFAQVFYDIIQISWVCIVDTPMLGWAYYSRQLAGVPARLIQLNFPDSWLASLSGLMWRLMLPLCFVFANGFQRWVSAFGFVFGLLAGVSAYVQPRFARSCSELQELQEL